MEQIVREAEVALESVKGIAGEAGVEQHSRIFAQQAKENGATAKRWLKAAGWLGAGSAGWVLAALLLWPLSTATTSEAISSLGARFAILTLLLFGLGFALRQYASSKHNETINLHRQNALKTFKTFVSAASEPEVRDAVLLEAARLIFAPQTSGVLRGRQEAGSPSTLVEVIRRIGSGTSSKS